MQIVYRTHNVTEAYLIKGLLEQQGMFCDVIGEYLAGGMGEISGSNFIFVRVKGADADAAVQLIDDMDTGKLEDAGFEFPETTGQGPDSEFSA